MKKTFLILPILLLTGAKTFAESKPNIPANEVNSIFKAAGFNKTNKGWKADCGIGQITTYKDLNGDGLKDAIITDASTKCYGNTDVGYYIVAQQKNGKWQTIFENAGIPTFLKSTGKDGWPDIENGGPGLCFAVYRWNGKSYEVNRYEYQGKACSLF